MKHRKGEESQTYHCAWELKGKRFTVWMPDDPQVRVAGKDVDEIEEKLRDAVFERYEDPTPLFEYDPPWPMSGREGQLAAKGIVCIRASNQAANWRNEEQELFSGGICPVCKYSLGTRSEVPLKIALEEVSADGAFSPSPRRGPNGRDTLDIFAEPLAEAISALGEIAFEWREVTPVPSLPPIPLKVGPDIELAPVKVRPSRKPRHRYFEPVGNPLADFTWLRELKLKGWGCTHCHRRSPGWWWENKSGMCHFVAEEALPESLPQAFLLGRLGSSRLCLKAESWRQLLAIKKWKGVSSEPIGVAPEKWVERKPVLEVVG